MNISSLRALAQSTGGLQRKMLLATATLVALTILLTTGWNKWLDDRYQKERMEWGSKNLARSIGVLVNDRLQRVDDDIRRLRDEIMAKQLGAKKSGGTIQGADKPIDLRGLQWVSAGGSVQLGSAAVQPGGSEFNEMLAFHRGNTSDTIYLGDRQISPVDGQPVLPVSRTVRAPDGSFAGVVVGALPLSAVGQLAEEINLGSNGVAAVVSSDGVLLARWPSLPGVTGRFGVRWDDRSLEHLAPGTVRTFVARSPSDGIERLFAQASAGDHMVISVGLATEDIFGSPWKRQLRWMIFAVSSSALIGLLLLLLRSVLRQARAWQRSTSVTLSQLEHLRQALDQHAIVSIIDNGGDILYANANFCRVMKCELKDVIGRNQRTFNSGVHPRSFYENIQQELEHDRPFRGTICDRDRLGELHWFDLTIVAVRHEHDGPREFIVVRTDITASREAVQQLERAVGQVRVENDSLHRVARTDALTGLPNRRAFDEAAREVLQRVQGGGPAAALLMMDVDWFKSYNDTAGHVAGDEALRRVATAVRAVLKRSEDQVFRYGGEEFAVLCTAQETDHAWRTAQAVRVAVANLGLPHPGQPGRNLTISVGVRIATSSTAPASLDQWIAAADQALYRAKAAGRNACVESTAADPPASDPAPAAPEPTTPGSKIDPGLQGLAHQKGIA